MKGYVNGKVIDEVEFMEGEQQKDIKKVFELMEGMMFQFGFLYGAILSKELKDELKKLKKKLIN